MSARAFSALRRAFCAVALLAAASGCGTFDPQEARRGQTDAFSAELRERLAALPDRPLSLDDCIKIALTNNYSARLADLDRELARLGKTTAFSAFLPRVSASVGYTDRDYDNILGQAADGRLVYGPATDTASTLTAALPVFSPASWFLYAAARHGEASAAIAAYYTRQNIVLQTTAAYCDVLVQLDTVRALETQLSAAERLSERLSGLSAEGFVADWERGQADLQALARRTELDSARRRLRVLQGRLLQTIGLPPDAEIGLSGDCGNARAPEGPVEDLVILALMSHPQLALADRRVVMGELAVRRAFCNFLPTLSINATHVWGGEDLAFDALGWSTGFQGAWSVFSGFANSAAYRTALVERRQSELQRENTFLSIILGVMAAEAQLRDARESVAVRQLAYDVAAAKSADRDDRAAEGLIPVSDALDARSEMDFAQVALIRSRYQETIAIANLELAMGIPFLPPEYAPPLAPPETQPAPPQGDAP